MIVEIQNNRVKINESSFKVGDKVKLKDSIVLRDDDDNEILGEVPKGTKGVIKSKKGDNYEVSWEKEYGFDTVRSSEIVKI